MGFFDSAQEVLDKGVSAAKGAVSGVAVEQQAFMKGFVRLCNDGWNQGWHERNGGNLTYRICLLYTSFGHDISKAFTRGIGRTLWSTAQACRPRMRSGTFCKALTADPTRRSLESEWLFGQARQGSWRKGSSDPFLFGFQCDIIFISARSIDRWTFDRHPV